MVSKITEVQNNKLQEKIPVFLNTGPFLKLSSIFATFLEVLIFALFYFSYYIFLIRSSSFFFTRSYNFVKFSRDMYHLPRMDSIDVVFFANSYDVRNVQVSLNWCKTFANL